MTTPKQQEKAKYREVGHTAAGALLLNDHFREVSDSSGASPGRVTQAAEPCHTKADCVHMNTTRGQWCIVATTPIRLLEKV